MKLPDHVSACSIDSPLLPCTCSSVLTFWGKSHLMQFYLTQKFCWSYSTKYWGQQINVIVVHSALLGREEFLFIDLFPSMGTAFPGINGTLSSYFSVKHRQGRAFHSCVSGQKRLACSSTSFLHLPGQAGMMQSARWFSTGSVRWWWWDGMLPQKGASQG